MGPVPNATKGFIYARGCGDSHLIAKARPRSNKRRSIELSPRPLFLMRSNGFDREEACLIRLIQNGQSLWRPLSQFVLRLGIRYWQDCLAISTVIYFPI